MGNRTLVRGAALFFALIVLILSVLETSSVKYAFGAKPDPTAGPREVDVTYELPYPGTVTPGSPLWPLKALRDKVSLEMSGDLLNQANFKLHLADKRLASGIELWASGNTNEALLTLEKSEGYLLSSFDSLKGVGEQEGVHDTVRHMTYASLKHRQVLEKVLAECGDEARSMVTKLLDTPKFLYTAGSSRMVELGMTPPDNPF
jgi:hypothetical protein